jgi:hypothetical protein
VALLKSAEAKPPRSVHRLDEPAGLSLRMVPSPQCRFCFARQIHCSPTTTCGQIVAVGTIIADRPPHGSVRARLRIRLLLRMTGVEAIIGMGMQDTG